MSDAKRGCCSTCDGTGMAADVDTNGLCSDCYATGHDHPYPERCGEP